MRWEYKTIKFKKRSFFSGSLDTDELNQEINALGRDGWELVSICPVSSRLICQDMASRSRCGVWPPLAQARSK